MTIASDIISCRMPDLDRYVAAGESLDDIDEYGFTPLIETAITRQIDIAKALLSRGVDVNKPDVTGRTALHWAVDNQDILLSKLFIEYGANTNAYTNAGLSVLVYPMLRDNDSIKHLLYQNGAKLDFALDFILAKLLGHRFELNGYVDIINAEGEFIELNYEGFILEFTVAVIKDSMRRFCASFSSRHLRSYFHYLYVIMDAFSVAEELLSFQHHAHLTDENIQQLTLILKSESMLILPAASRGHAMGFIKYGSWFAKIDRGENSLTEGCVNIYQINKPQAFDVNFLQQFLFKKQPRRFFHQEINAILQLKPIATFPMTSQITGNCSWANMQGIMPVAFALQKLEEDGSFSHEQASTLSATWTEWDKDRALDEAMQRFYLADKSRKASIASMLGAVLFQSCDYASKVDVARADKILTILALPDYYYILKSYLDIYCVKKLTHKGNNLLKLLDDCGINPNIGVSPIATQLHSREQS